MRQDPSFKLNKSVVSKGSDLGLGSQDEIKYWAQKNPQERWAALEYLRQVVYGYDPLTERVQRVFSIIKQPWS